MLRSHASKIGFNQTTTQRILSALVLAGILSVGASLALRDAAIAYPETSKTEISQRPRNNPDNRLPSQVVNAVRRDLSGKTGIAPGQLKITNYSQETWPNGCLGLAEPDQICTQALVPGWRVVVSHGGKTWVYRTNNSGSVVKLDEAASQTKDTDKLKPISIPTSEMPPPLTAGILFRAISSGGIIGRTYETTLMNDGRLMRVRIGDANDSERSVRQVSPQHLQKFKQLLQRQSLARFDGMSYQAPNGAADFITVTITSSAGTTRYADILQNRLPQPLQQVVQSWEQIVSGQSLVRT